MEKVKSMLSTFACVTTLVIVATAIYISIFWGTDVDMDISILWEILGTSFLTSIGMLFCPVGELSKKRFVITTIIYYIYVNIVVLGSGFIYEWFYLEQIKMVIGMVLLIAVVFTVVILIMFAKDIPLAKKLNCKLEERNQNID